MPWLPGLLVMHIKVYITKFDMMYLSYFLHIGAYLVLDSTNASKDDFAILQSPIVSTTKQYGCLSFFYNMYGDNIGSLEFQFLDVNSGNPSTMWILEGKQGYWTHGQFPLPKGQNMTDYALYIIGKLGGPKTSDIALDDVIFQLNDCDGKNVYQILYI